MVSKCEDCTFCKKIKGKYCCTIDSCNDEIDDIEEIGYCAWFNPNK